MLELTHSSMFCNQFTAGGKEIEKTVIVGPIRIFESLKEEGIKAYDLVIGCNMFRDCENGHCGYSWVSRQERRKRIGQVQT